MAVAEVPALVEQADMSKHRTISSRRVLRTQLLPVQVVQVQVLRQKIVALVEALLASP